MNKELLEVLAKNIRYTKEYIGNDTYRLYIKKNDIELLEKYLTELEQIKNTKPSEALKCLKEIGEIETDDINNQDIMLKDDEDFKEDYNIIKQALLKAQEQEKVIEIIKELKRLGDNINDILEYDTYEDYINSKWNWSYELTEEEFESLKRWLG